MIHALVVSMLLAAAPAKDAAPPDPATVARAKELFSAGQKLYKAGKFAEAIARFEESYAARPHPVIIFNIGKCWEQLEENGRALRAYRDYLRLAPNAQDKESVSDSVANLERRLREKGLQQVMIYAEPETARILVDGKDIGASPASTELPAGTHALTVTADGYEKVERTFTMSLARASDLTVVLEKPKAVAAVEPKPAPSDAPKVEPKPSESKLDPGPPLVATAGEPAKKTRLWTWVAGGVAVASLGAGVGLGVATNGAAEKYRSVEHAPDQVQADAAAVQGLATGANVTYGVAAAAAVTAVVLFFLEK